MDNILREKLLRFTCLPYGPPAHTAASTVLASTRIQERTRSTKSELEERSQQWPTKDGVHLGGSRGGSSWQTRVASECGPMCPVGYRMNQGQGQGQYSTNLQIWNKTPERFVRPTNDVRNTRSI